MASHLPMTAAVVLVSISCSSAPPTGPTPTAISIAQVPSVFVVGTSHTLSANDANTGQELLATWSSSDGRVFAVVGNRITAIGVGSATITARYNQSSSSVSVRSVPSLAGDYRGEAFVVDCQDNLPGYCASNVPLESRGRTLTIVLLTLTQTLDVVTGRLVLLSTDGLITGAIESDGRLHLAGTLENRVDRTNGPAVAIETWSTSQRDTALVGSFRMRIFQVLRGQPADTLGVATVELRGLERLP